MDLGLLFGLDHQLQLLAPRLVLLDEVLLRLDIDVDVSIGAVSGIVHNIEIGIVVDVVIEAVADIDVGIIVVWREGIQRKRGRERGNGPYCGGVRYMSLSRFLAGLSIADYAIFKESDGARERERKHTCFDIFTKQNWTFWDQAVPLTLFVCELKSHGDTATQCTFLSTKPLPGIFLPPSSCFRRENIHTGSPHHTPTSTEKQGNIIICYFWTTREIGSHARLTEGDICFNHGAPCGEYSIYKI